MAYTEMGHARRRLLHRRAFEVLEEGGAPAARLARHALAGSFAESAFRYSVAAGDAAMEVFAARDAIEHYERARSLLAEEGRTGGGRPVEPSIHELEHLYTQLGRAYEIADEWGKAQAAYETMLALGQQLGEARLEVLSLNHLAILSFTQQEPDLPKTKTHLEEARRLAEEAGLEGALVETECNLADLMTLLAGEYEHTDPLARKALDSARALEEERPDLVARALLTLARVELNRGRLGESAVHAEEGAELSRDLAERPPPHRLLPSMGTAAVGLVASWTAGIKTMESRSLSILAFDRVMQGRLREGIKIAREALAVSRELPKRAEALGVWVLGMGNCESGDYKEALELCRRATELTRKAQNAFLLWFNLDNLGRAYEALLDLQEARRVHEEALELSGALGPQYEVSSSIRLCAVAALSEDWEQAYAHALRAHEGRASLGPLDSLYLHYEVEALLRGGDERLAQEEVRRFAERAEPNERERVAYLRSLAVLSEFEGAMGRAIEHLHEAWTLAQKIGLPKELWQIQSRIGHLYEQRGQTEEAREEFSLAAQTL
ncbi:MAG: tetratricopeptide repeat protein, partial [Rubrobacter sp.]